VAAVTGRPGRATAGMTCIAPRPPLFSVAGFRLAVEALADRLHAGGDAQARAWGWEVTRTSWGGRTYRDPRMSRLSATGGGGVSRRAVAGRGRGRSG